jgi:hypothetical protein
MWMSRQGRGPQTKGGTMNLDLELLSEQKQILLETIWDVEEQDRRYKLWGIVELIDYLQDQFQEVG